MVEARLLRSQKNQFYSLIVDRGLNPAEFEWVEEPFVYTETYNISVLRHKESGYYFKFNNDTLLWYPVYSPSDTTHLYICDNPCVYGYVIRCFEDWLTYLSREISTSDLWEELTMYEITGEVLEDEEEPNSLFDKEQLIKITHGIEQIRSYLLKEYPGKEEAELINKKLDYLIVSASKLGRVDWKNIFVSTIISIGTNLALSPEQFNQVKVIFNSAWNGFIKLIGN